MELSVKEFRELVGLTLEARAEAWRSAERAAEANAKGSTGVPVAPAQSGTGVVPTPEVAYARFVIDTAEISRVVAEAKALTREACAARLEEEASRCDTSLVEAVRYGMKECQPELRMRAEIMRMAASLLRGEVTP